MGVREALKAAGGAVAGLFAAQSPAGPRSLEGQAAATPGRAFGATQQAIPDDVQAAMERQGMFTGEFTPGVPLNPYQPVGAAPVLTPFPVGYNVFAVPRGATGVSFDTLAHISGAWDILRMCVEVRADELRALDWEIGAADEDDGERYASELKAAQAFFERPDGVWDFDTFQAKLAEDWLRFDALTIFRHRTRAGKLAALEAIDGTTIMPAIDARGGVPRYPAPAYIQWAWGLPWAWLTDRDVIYQPHRPRTQTRYGLPALEWLLLRANTDLREQWYFLTYFTRGEVPEAFVNAPKGTEDPAQIAKLQNAYSAVMSGAAAAHHAIKWIPPDAKVTLARKQPWDLGLAQYMDGKACAALKVQPHELGFIEDVNRSTGQTQENVQFRRSVKPSTQYMARIWNRILREDLGMPYARFKYLGIEEEEDQLLLAQVRQIYMQNGVLSPDEVRSELGYDIDPEAPVGRLFVGRTALFFVDKKSQEAARAAGSLAAQAGIGTPAPTEPQPTDEDQDTEDDPALMTPGQLVVDPGIKPKPAEGPGGSAAPAPAAAKAVRDDLKKWRDVALKRAKAGKPQRPFESEVIPPLVKGLLWRELEAATSADEVREAFAPALGGGTPLAKRDEAGGGPPQPSVGKPVKVDQAKKAASMGALAAAVAKILKAQAKKVAAHVRAGAEEKAAAAEIAAASDGAPATVDAILSKLGWQGWDGQLKAAVEPHLAAMWRQGATEGGDAIGITLSWDLLDPKAVEYAEARGAELVGKRLLADGTLVDNPNGKYVISNATRQMVREHVVSALKAGATPRELEKSIQEHYAFSTPRAETIARTETGFAYNHGAVGGYRQAGLSQVEVMDGDYDDECAAANGQIWSLEHAEADPLAHPNCLPGDVLVLAPNLEAAFARWFEGEVVVLRTAEDDLLTCTPNHPVLTDHGWVAAGRLRQGDHVIRCVDGKRVARLLDPDDDQVPTRIEQVARAFLESPTVTACAVPAAAVDFHGDGAGSEIYVVGSNSLGDRGRQAAVGQHRREFALVGAGVGLRPFLPGGTAAEIVSGALHATNGVVGGGGASLPSFGASPRGSDANRVPLAADDAQSTEPRPHGRRMEPVPGGDLVRGEALTDVELAELLIRRTGRRRGATGMPQNEASGREAALDDLGATAGDGSDLVRALAVLVEPVEVAEIHRELFAAHVFNLQTVQGWYVAGNIITHNCTRAFAPVPIGEGE